MRSNKFETVEVEISWSNIQDQIASLLYALGKVPESQEITNIKLEYAGGYLPVDKKIKVTILKRKEVESFNING